MDKEEIDNVFERITEIHKRLDQLEVLIQKMNKALTDHVRDRWEHGDRICR